MALIPPTQKKKNYPKRYLCTIYIIYKDILQSHPLLTLYYILSRLLSLFVMDTNINFDYMTSAQRSQNLPQELGAHA